MRKFWLIFLAIVFFAAGMTLYVLRNAFFGVNFFILFSSLCCFGVAYLAILFWPWQKPLARPWARWLKFLTLAAAVLLVVGFAWVQSLIWYTAARANTGAAQSDYLLVLGAGLNGETPSVPLVSRLDAALHYLRENPQAVAVLSGGQGPGETIPEAWAMQRYLMAYGVAEERLILEDRSTSTAENLAYSLPLLRELGAQTVVIVSNDFHLYRAGKLANYYGLEAEFIGSPVSRYGLVRAINYLREYFAVVKELFCIYLTPYTLPIPQLEGVS